jgi:hypothetical protein
VQTGPQLLVVQLWLRIDLTALVSSQRHLTGAAPLVNSSQRLHPAVRLPNTGPPHECFVVVDFCQAIILSFHVSVSLDRDLTIARANLFAKPQNAAYVFLLSVLLRGIVARVWSG